MTTAAESIELVDGTGFDFYAETESLMITLEMRIGRVVPAELRPLYDQWLVLNEEAMKRDSSEEAAAASETALSELIRALQGAGVKSL